MSDTAKIARFTAAAYGMALNAKPGYSGVSASGWAVWDNERNCEVCRKVKPSEKANRTQWAARIRAIRGALEAKEVPDGSTIEVATELTAMTTFGRVLRGERTTAEGKELGDLDLWDEVLAVIQRKRLHAVPDLRRSGIGLVLLATLAAPAKSEAIKRRAVIGPKVEAETALPPKKPRKPPFPPADEEG